LPLNHPMPRANRRHPKIAGKLPVTALPTKAKGSSLVPGESGRTEYPPTTNQMGVLLLEKAH
jgi:hypothetical protein